MADDEFKVKKERDPILMVCFVVFILTVCAVTGAAIYNNDIRADDRVAVMGDSVSVNYTGTFYDEYGKEQAVVFDTSLWSIANNDDILKSNDFTARAESNYTPLSFTVGGTQVLKGFGDAVIGHKVGDKFRVMLPVGEGYNAPFSLKTVNASSTVTMQATETLTPAQFKTLYGFDLNGFTEIEETVYGWPGTATFNSSSNTITMSYQPKAGSSYNAVDSDFGKVDLNVISVSGSQISYNYTVSDYTVVSSSGDIQMIKVDFGTQKFYITSVTDANGDDKADTFTTRNVEERNNQVLYFEIELVSIN